MNTWNLESGTDELICKVEIETDIENKCMDTKKGRLGGMDREIGIDIYTLLCIKQATNDNQRHRTGDSIQRCADLNEKEIQKRGTIRIHGVDSLCSTAETTNTAL